MILKAKNVLTGDGETIIENGAVVVKGYFTFKNK